MKKSSKAAKRYAKALLYTALAGKNEKAVLDDLKAIRDLMDRSQDFRVFMAREFEKNPKARTAVLKELLQGKVNKLTLDFLMFLDEKKDLDLFPEIVPAFEKYFRRSAGTSLAHITAARAFSREQAELLLQKLKARFGAALEMETSEDPALLGGFLVQVEDQVYDYSIAGRLERLRSKMIQA